MKYESEDLDYIKSKLLYKDKVLTNYCIQTRGMKYVPKDWALLTPIEIKDGMQKLPASIVIPIKDLKGDLQGFEMRALSKLADVRYNKIFTDNVLPLYNVLNKRFNSTVVLTEGAIDCEIIFQHSDMNCISSVSASVHSYMLHLLAFIYKRIIIVFDNDKDDTGLNKSKEVQKFMKKYYKEVVSCEIFDISLYTKEKDIGDVAVKDRFKIIKEIEKIYYKKG